MAAAICAPYKIGQFTLDCVSIARWGYLHDETTAKNKVYPKHQDEASPTLIQHWADVLCLLYQTDKNYAR